MIDRRFVLQGTLATAILAGSPLPVRAGLSLRLASVKFGTLAWLIKTIKAEELDKKHGLDLDVVVIATNQSSPITLFGGSADVIVSDWPWALQQRARGEALKFSPFSASLGAVMVPGDSDIKTLSDLKGKRLGVAGSSIDKSWLLLQAYVKKTLGFDFAKYVVPQYGAAPLLAEQAKDGKLDAVLNFWTFSARLRGIGFRDIITMSDVMKELGIEPQPALVGYVWKASTEKEKGPAIDALLAAVSDANALLATSDSAWERLRPLMKVSSDEEFKALVAGYRSGIPGAWTEAEMKSAEKIMSYLVEGGYSEPSANGKRFDPELFHTSST